LRPFWRWQSDTGRHCWYVTFYARCKTITDGSVEVAGHRLNDWMTWGAAKTDEFDPLVQGAESVFGKLVKS
jgi:hypothetical protein